MKYFNNKIIGDSMDRLVENPIGCGQASSDRGNPDVGGKVYEIIWNETPDDVLIRVCHSSKEELVSNLQAILERKPSKRAKNLALRTIVTSPRYGTGETDIILDSIGALVEAGAEINTLDSFGNNLIGAFLISRRRTSLDEISFGIVEGLANMGCSINHMNDYGNTPFSIMIEFFSDDLYGSQLEIDIIYSFVKLGADKKLMIGDIKSRRVFVSKTENKTLEYGYMVERRFQVEKEIHLLEVLDIFFNGKEKPSLFGYLKGNHEVNTPYEPKRCNLELIKLSCGPISSLEELQNILKSEPSKRTKNLALRTIVTSPRYGTGETDIILDSIGALVEAGAEINTLDSFGNNLIGAFLISRRGTSLDEISFGIVEGLANMGCSINHANDYGCTPFMISLFCFVDFKNLDNLDDINNLKKHIIFFTNLGADIKGLERVAREKGCGNDEVCCLLSELNKSISIRKRG